MRHVSLKTRRRKKARAEREALLYEAAPWCARCGDADPDQLSGHERLGRAQGGDATRPDCLLCHRCNTWCEDNSQYAAWTGWKISKKHPHDPRLADDEAEDLNYDIVVFGEVCEVKR